MHGYYMTFCFCRQYFGRMFRKQRFKCRHFDALKESPRIYFRFGGVSSIRTDSCINSKIRESYFGFPQLESKYQCKKLHSEKQLFM